MNLSEEEQAVIIDELAERMKDVIFMNAKDQATKVFRQIPRSHWADTDNTIEVTYVFKLVINDLVQIIGRERRKIREMASWM